MASTLSLPRKVAWYGDNYYQYKYSGVIRDSLPWDRVLAKLKKLGRTAAFRNI